MCTHAYVFTHTHTQTHTNTHTHTHTHTHTNTGDITLQLRKDGKDETSICQLTLLNFLNSNSSTFLLHICELQLEKVVLCILKYYKALDIRKSPLCSL